MQDYTDDAPSSSSEKNNCVSVCLSSILSAATAPVLVHFTINFTITNLAFEEDISRPGSRKFNITERILQSLVRVLLTVPNTAHTGVSHAYLSHKSLKSGESPAHCT